MSPIYSQIITGSALVLAIAFIHRRKARWTAEHIPLWLITSWQIIGYWLVRCILAPILAPYTVRSRAPRIHDRKPGLILVANHHAVYDAFLATAALPWHEFRQLVPIRYMTKDAFFRTTWQRIFLLPSGCFAAKQNRDVRGIDLAATFLASGQSVFIFPEGRIVSPEGERQARIGAAYLAAKLKRNVLPLYIAWPKAPWYGPFTRRTGIYYGPLLHAPQKPGEDLQPLANDLVAYIYGLENPSPAHSQYWQVTTD